MVEARPRGDPQRRIHRRHAADALLGRLLRGQGLRPHLLRGAPLRAARPRRHRHAPGPRAGKTDFWQICGLADDHGRVLRGRGSRPGHDLGRAGGPGRGRRARRQATGWWSPVCPCAPPCRPSRYLPHAFKLPTHGVDDEAQVSELLPRPVRLLIGATSAGVSERRLRQAVAGKVVLVTGASSGVGAATRTAARLSRRRRCCWWPGGRSCSNRCAIEIISRGGRGVAYPCDLADADAGRTSSPRDVLEQHGHVDVDRLQRRTLDPPLDLRVLRALPRHRAHDQRQLSRTRAAAAGAAAFDARARQRPHRQRGHDRRGFPALCAGARTSPPSRRSRPGWPAWRRRSAPTA